jgi:hypothetical protein
MAVICHLSSVICHLSSVISVSRVILGAHSFSEVCLGWALGAAVSLFVISAIRTPLPIHWADRFLPRLFLFAFYAFAAQILPFRTWAVKLAMVVSGRAHLLRC